MLWMRQGEVVVVFENKSRIPDVYFSYNEDFDYRRYLEEKSHFDEVVLSVDRATRDVVGSADRLSERIGVGVRVLSGSIDKVGDRVNEGFDRVEGKLEGIDRTLQSGFQALEINLDRIDSSINDLSYLCEIGFEKLATHAVRTNELLEELVTLFKTPDQVWAREQFEYAKTCMENELWEDALAYSNKSINGDERHAGFHIEPAFHFLKAKILMQYPDVATGDEFLKMALASFQDALKYCGKGQSKLAALTLLNISWCYYCLGKFHKAILEIERSIGKDDSNPLASFLKAKYEARSGAFTSSELSLKDAILRDEILFLRASNDQDFNHSDIDLERIARQARDHQLEKLASFCREIRYQELLGVRDILATVEADSISEKDKIISQLDYVIGSIQTLKDDKILAVLNDFFLRGGGKFPCAAAEIMTYSDAAWSDAKRVLREYIERLEKDRHQDNVASERLVSRRPLKGALYGPALLTAFAAFVGAVWFLFSLPSNVHPVFQLFVAIGRFLLAALAIPAVLFGFMLYDRFQVEKLFRRDFAMANDIMGANNQVAQERVRMNHAKAAVLRQKLGSVLSG